MPKLEYNLRYSCIIKRLRRSPASFNEISDYLESESDFHGYDFNISKRTFLRDLEEIRQFLHVDIMYDFSKRVYYIKEENREEENNRMLEAYDMFNVLNKTDSFADYIFFEKRRPQGTEHFYGLLHAIKNSFFIQLKHKKFWDDEETERRVKPLGLKEFKGRWYLIAKDEKSDPVKTFGLDRILDFTITKQRFEKVPAKEINALFTNCFGIINPTDTEPEKIVLSFTPFEGKYILSYPFHHSQHKIKQDEKETRIELYMHVTEDFIMELLSYGEELKVIAPASLKKEIMVRLKNALMQYK